MNYLRKLQLKAKKTFFNVFVLVIGLCLLAACNRSSSVSHSKSAVHQSLKLNSDTRPRNSKSWNWSCEEARQNTNKFCLYRHVINKEAKYIFSNSDVWSDTKSALQEEGNGIYYLHIQYRVMTRDLSQKSVKNCNLSVSSTNMRCLFESDIEHVLFRLDNIDPDIVIYSQKISPSNSQQWAWSCQNNELCAFRYEINSNEVHEFSESIKYGATNSANLETKKDGNYYLHLQAQDLAGNTSDVVSANVIIDVTKPALELTQVPKNFNKAFRQATWAWSCSDIHGCSVSFEFSKNSHVIFEDESFLKDLSSFVSPSNISGIYYFHLQARDGAGNRSDLITHKLKMDHSLAFITIDTPEIINLKSASTYPISGKCSDRRADLKIYAQGNLMKQEVLCRNGNWQAKLNLSDYEDSKHFRLEVVLENVFKKRARAAIVLLKDTIAPSLSFKKLPSSDKLPWANFANHNKYIVQGFCDQEIVGQEIKAAFSYGGFSSKTKVTTVCEKNSTWIITIDLPINKFVSKNYMDVVIEATDASGNTGSHSSFIYYDIEKPKLRVRRTKAINNNNVSSYSGLSGRCEDTDLDILVLLDGYTESAPWKTIPCEKGARTFSNNWSLKKVNLRGLNLKEEDLKFRFIQIDEAGNRGEATVLVTVDFSDPEFDITAPPQNVGKENILNVSGTCSDVYYFKAYVFPKDANHFVKSTNKICTEGAWKIIDWDMTSLDFGKYTLSIEAEDRSGNTLIKNWDFEKIKDDAEEPNTEEPESEPESETETDEAI